MNLSAFTLDKTTYRQLTKWDRRFLELAKHVATWSKDPSTKVGAVIVDEDKRVVSLGFNGFARGVEDSEERLNNRELKYKLIVHAERNALLFARQPLEGCTMYTWPLPPCSACASMIIQSGIERVIAPVLSEELKERWESDVLLAASIMDQASVILDLVPEELMEEPCSG